MLCPEALVTGTLAGLSDCEPVAEVALLETTVLSGVALVLTNALTGPERACPQCIPLIDIVAN